MASFSVHAYVRGCESQATELIGPREWRTKRTRDARR